MSEIVEPNLDISPESIDLDNLYNEVVTVLSLGQYDNIGDILNTETIRFLIININIIGIRTINNPISLIHDNISDFAIFKFI